jgi:hypothetical protein
MNRTVKIACDEQGQYSVGLEGEVGVALNETGQSVDTPPEAKLEPAASLDDALAKAKAIFETPQSADGSPSPFDSMQRGFDRVRPPAPAAAGGEATGA